MKTRALGGVYKSSQHIASKTNINQPIKMNDNPEKECSMDFYGGGVDDEDHFIKNNTTAIHQRRSTPHNQAMKKWLFCLLERPNTRLALCYHTASLLLIIGSLIVGVLDTVASLEDRLMKVVFYYELFLLIWFSTEFMLRLWSCNYMSRYRGARGKLNFICSMYMMIDIFVILSTITTLILNNEVLDATYFPVLRATRFMQVFRLLRVDRQRGDIKTMGAVVRNHSKELVTVYFVGFVIMFSATYIVYLCERHVVGYEGNLSKEVTITNMVDGLYWAAITVTSVGYGDYSPVTWSGKLVCSIFALVGCAFFSLPAGILGTGFALQQKKEKRFIKVRNPAACLLQTVWRDYALKRENSAHFEATWYYYLSKLRNDDAEDVGGSTDKTSHNRTSLPLPSTPNNTRSSLPLPSPNLLKKRSSSTTTAHAEVDKEDHTMSPLEGGMKRIGKLITGGGSKTNNSANNGSCHRTGNEQSVVLRRSNVMHPKYGYHKLSLPTTTNNNGIISAHHKDSLTKNVFSGNEGIRLVHQNGRASVRENRIHLQMMSKYKDALRFILKLKFHTVMKTFKNKRHPFVNVQDFMEKNNMNHIEMLSHIKNMRDSFNVLQQELIDLRYSLVELKQDRLEEKASREATRLLNNS